MMKFTVALAVLVSALALTSATPECSVALDVNDFPTEWVSMANTCIDQMERQIQMEIGASYAYLEMGAYFSRDTVNRPGFADFFFNAAKEEREHGSKLIEYLSMRGELTDRVSNLITVPVKAKATMEWTGVSSLEEALRMETDVTKSIRKVIEECEKVDKNNDYHLVDYLTGVYLEEQFKGQREIAGKLATLKKMEKTQGALAEFLFDKQM